MNKPAIGRIVLYNTTEQDRILMSYPKVPGNAQKVLPAVIVAIHSDTTVNLKVICDSSVDAWRTSVTLGTGEGNWQWPVREDITVGFASGPTATAATASL